MKIHHLLLTTGILLFFVSCSKDKSAEKQDSGKDTETETFQPVTAGSTWHYKDATGQDAGFTLTATNKDTLVEGKTFTIFDSKPDTSSASTEALFGNSDNDYYIRGVFPVLGDDALLYFKDSTAVQTTWTQNITINYPVIGKLNCLLTLTLTKVGATEQVNGVTYKNTAGVNFKIEVVLPTGNGPLATGALLVSRGVGILSLRAATAASTVADYVLDGYEIK